MFSALSSLARPNAHPIRILSRFVPLQLISLILGRNASRFGSIVMPVMPTPAHF